MRFLLRSIPVALVVIGIGCNTDKVNRLENENRDLTTKLEAVTKAASLEGQAKCAQQARAEFEADGWAKKPMASFTNHYNAQLNKCFIQIQSSEVNTKTDTIFTYRTVMDAFEGRGYAEYSWKSDTTKKYWEVAPFVCKVTTLSGGQEVYCKSTEEFDELVKQFMQ